MTNTFREHPQRAILETCDLWDIWSEWWGYMTWPTKRQWQRQLQWKSHLENILEMWSPRLMTFETFDKSDSETLPDQQKDKDKDDDKDKYI